MVHRPASWGVTLRAAALILPVALCLAASSGARAALRQAPDIDLDSSVQALKESHPAAADQLPNTQKDLERKALPIIYKLPLVFQEAYLLTCQDYSKMGPGDQQKFNNLIRTLAFLPRAQQNRLITGLANKVKAMSPDQIGTARTTPHDTCFLINAALAAKAGK